MAASNAPDCAFPFRLKVWNLPTTMRPRALRALFEAVVGRPVRFAHVRNAVVKLPRATLTLKYPSTAAEIVSRGIILGDVVTEVTLGDDACSVTVPGFPRSTTEAELTLAVVEQFPGSNPSVSIEQDVITALQRVGIVILFTEQDLLAGLTLSGTDLQGSNIYVEQVTHDFPESVPANRLPHRG